MGLPIIQGTVPNADDFNLFQSKSHDGLNVEDYLDGMRPMTALIQLQEYQGSARMVRMIVSENVLFYKRDDNDISSPADVNGSVILDALERRWKRLYGDVTATIAEILAETETVKDQTIAVKLEAEAMLDDTINKINIMKFGGLGDFTPEGTIIIACGDSTTEQFNGNNGGSEAITILRNLGEAWEKLVGFVNFGGSGYTLSGFVNGALQTLPIIPTTGVSAISNWDYYGHKPAGAISLATAMAWRAGKADRALWRICYGINDLILYAATGNLSLQAIVNYLAPLLRTAITSIMTTYPRDSIVLEIPNPMTARPFIAPGPGFPSYTAYPTFGADLSIDQALVEKWNQSLRATYILVQNEFSKTKLIDSWKEYFGNSDTTLPAVTGLPFLTNLVHPTGIADAARIRGLARVTNPKPTASEGRRVEASARSALLSINPWDIYPAYFRENLRYKLVAECTLSGAGSNYIDIVIPYTEFIQQVSGPIYITVADRVSQYFPTYSASVSGANTRLTGVVLNSAMQASAAKQNIHIYQDNLLSIVAKDVYVNSAAIVSKEYIDISTITGGGTGYIDIKIPNTVGRVSTKFLTGLKNGTLVIGGSIASTLALSTATSIARTGSTSGRTLRISLAGTYTSWVGQPAAITFSDTAPSPKAFEYVPKQVTIVPHAIGNKGWVYTDLDMVDGATLSAQNLTAVSAITVIDVYYILAAVRTLLGTITITGNNTSIVNMSSGNPLSVTAGQVYEFVITSNTTNTSPIKCILSPT